MKLALYNATNMSLSAARRRSGTAFSLLEVMIAAGIFFMCIFAILSLVSTNIRNARKLQEQPLDLGMVLSDQVVQLSMTNDIENGSTPVDISDLFPGYTCEVDIDDFPGSTNGLKVLVCTAKKDNDPNSVQTLSTLLYNPRAQRMGMGMGMH